MSIDLKNQVKLPIGAEFFDEIREDGAYYVDKTGFIPQLVYHTSKVMLFTRPRRFGKTLTMTMLHSFFDISRDSKKVFEGLKISEYPDLCAEWMNQYPVIFLTLKGVDGNSFGTAFLNLRGIIADAFGRHLYLKDSEFVDKKDLEIFLRLYNETEGMRFYQNLSEEDRKEAIKDELTSSLRLLSKMLADHWKKPVIIIIDEYDVPLAKANVYGYYDQMIEVIRALMNNALKSNDYLKKAFLTGCLRVSKESIFTGLNNLLVDTISKNTFSEFIGFTQGEVDQLLQTANLSQSRKVIKEWYDGYVFGDSEMYCPWDMMNYICDLQVDPNSPPIGYWENSSSNDVLAKFFEKGISDDAQEKFETLLSGGSILVDVSEELTYDSLLDDDEHFWSLLYMTGYLTKADKKLIGKEKMNLRIPNAEIHSLFTSTVIKRFRSTVREVELKPMFDAFWGGDEAELNQEVNHLLLNTISFYDNLEAFYHAFIAGIFSGAGFVVKTNRESGLGRPDIVVISNSKRSVLIFEIKKSEDPDQMELDCDKALKQIVDRKYSQEYKRLYPTIHCYGIAFFKKSCLIKKAE